MAKNFLLVKVRMLVRHDSIITLMLHIGYQYVCVVAVMNGHAIVRMVQEKALQLVWSAPAPRVRNDKTSASCGCSGDGRPNNAIDHVGCIVMASDTSLGYDVLFALLLSALT